LVLANLISSNVLQSRLSGIFVMNDSCRLTRFRWILSLIRTLRLIGPVQLARIAIYRLGLKMRLHPVLSIKAPVSKAPFFSRLGQGPALGSVSDEWRTFGLLFERHVVPIGNDSPDWFVNPVSGSAVPDVHRPWWKVPDFDPEVGDIKFIWELSRFNWAVALAQRARNGHAASLERLNLWIEDWCSRNPPYCGPHWKCGQEASIRIMNLATAAVLLQSVKASDPALSQLVLTHLRRIAPTMSYAFAQDNNHATSEAAALFIGGSWLAINGVMDGHKFASLGRRALEKSIARLVGADGSFSQYSVNYHRLVLDTLSLTERWRQLAEEPVFSARFYQRARAASHWLHSMVDVATGDAPNIGANDGSRILQLTATDYRDFRPSVQLASALFINRRAYPQGPHDDVVSWLGLVMPGDVLPPPKSIILCDGGFAVLRRRGNMAVLRFPRFRFRPSQNDVLHLDLWVGGINLAVDGGTYSYNSGDEWIEYYGGSASHNVVAFDCMPQMPRLGRFLLGDWIRNGKVSTLAEGEQTTSLSAAYSDRYGHMHQRFVTLANSSLLVEDIISGVRRVATLRWRLGGGGSWRLAEHRVSNGHITLNITANTLIKRFELVVGNRSRYYGENDNIWVLEVDVHEDSIILSEFGWNE
jgi:Heparinase II/III-like protein/Heparinase II/III N-terminus